MVLWRRRAKKPQTIADTIREKIGAGHLPREDYIKLWIGYGQGCICAACERPILRSQVEHEMQFADGRVISMHFGCVELYEAQRRQCG
jgi:hypothetical protein